MLIDKKETFSFLQTVKSHGWFQLAPFRFDDEARQLSYAIQLEGTTIDLTLSETPASISVVVDGKAGKSQVDQLVRRILRLDEPFERFHAVLKPHKNYSWIGENRIGPLLRSGTVFEDLVKTICTTNCSWSLTKSMVTNLVEKLGQSSANGTKAFPGPSEMAAQDSTFYREEIRAGYRSAYLAELATRVAERQIDPESWIASDLPADELLKEIKSIKGVGNYAAEHILKMIGRYEGLALDSFLRSGFYKKHNKGVACSDKKISSFYSRFGAWQGLVIWFDMTESEL